jgi:hypothetical protein
MTVTKYPYLKWQWIFYFLCRFVFFPLSLPWISPDLSGYMSKMVGVWNRKCLPFGILMGCVLLIFLGFFLCCPILRLYFMNSVLWCPLWFSHTNDECTFNLALLASDYTFGITNLNIIYQQQIIYLSIIFQNLIPTYVCTFSISGLSQRTYIWFGCLGMMAV